MIKNKIIGVLFIVIGVILPLGKKEYIKYKEDTSEKQVITYLNVTKVNDDSKIIKKISKIEKDYLAILEIPDINLKKGLVDLNSPYNNIKYNVEIIKGSHMPDIESTNLVLAAHNGNSEVSYFKDLDKLKIGANIYIYYLGYKYIYELSSINNIKKTGTVNIARNNGVNAVTLITCKKGSDTEQIVYLGYLISKEMY